MKKLRFWDPNNDPADNESDGASDESSTGAGG